MQPQRETMTDSLADIIQLISFGNRNGTLTVERGEGRTLEEGFITFQDGRVVEARVGHYTGAAAFNYLNAWRTCRFSFVNSIPTANRSMQPVQQQRTDITSSSLTTKAITQQGRAVSPSPYPARLQAGEEALRNQETLQLPRNHRRLLLLVNGQRSISELARLIMRNADEVQSMLNDLERSGFIQQ